MTTDISSDRDRSLGCLVGLAVGDAVGAPVEFRPRGTFKPLTDMIGGGQFCLKKGYWTDDTSMALCLAHSLTEHQAFNLKDQIERYCAWMDSGYMSSLNICFDVGASVSSALRRYQKTGDPLSGSKAGWCSGNGSIMRLAPIPIFYQQKPREAIFYGGESSKTTHRSALCVDACRYLSSYLVELLHGEKKTVFMTLDYQPETQEFISIKSGHFLNKRYQDLTGSGFVVDSLESALWCFIYTDSYESCVLAAANLGNDADTTAAIAGQMAGAYYGYSGIRQDWLDALFQHDEIVKVADSLYLASGSM
ncbi:ADP-ribosylglycohydrolase family protein [Vibrio salinus]|uniref:ADP-ribosylglycohydrolase family protein n=1 Tax=Vibrio salinus TaxID=2899784 RepID=UPI001E365B31|nr:ADP-ribosylglycohydrolase family protein [Vibrio salinus]MCE0495727.1 ADP-ribosylglycohydrolase family protein [Vibrio salinus]